MDTNLQHLRLEYTKTQWKSDLFAFLRDLLTVNFTNLPMHMLTILRCLDEKVNDDAMKQCDLRKKNRKGKVNNNLAHLSMPSAKRSAPYTCM